MLDHVDWLKVRDMAIGGGAAGVLYGGVASMYRHLKDDRNDRKWRKGREGTSPETVMLDIYDDDKDTGLSKLAGKMDWLLGPEQERDTIVVGSLAALASGYGALKGIKELSLGIRGNELKRRKDAARERYSNAMKAIRLKQPLSQIENPGKVQVVEDGEVKEAQTDLSDMKTRSKVVGGAALTWLLTTGVIGYATKKYLDSIAHKEDKRLSLGDIPDEPRIQVKYAGTTMDVDMTDVRTMVALNVLTRDHGSEGWDPGYLGTPQVKQALSDSNVNFDELIQDAKDMDFRAIMKTAAWNELRKPFTGGGTVTSYLDSIAGLNANEV